MAEAETPVISVDRLGKVFGPVCALHEVSLSLRRGEVHGLVGENGAGKSTLMRVLSGIEAPTTGRVLVDGEAVVLRGAAEAQRLGVAMIHQELNLVAELSVAENIFLGREPVRFGLIDRRRMIAEARAHLEAIGSIVDPRRPVGELSIAQQQMVEIAKAVAQDARVLIMDEPTAVLTRREVTLLFDLIGRLKARGVTIVYISHFLEEVIRVCDRITVLRDGQRVTTLDDPTRTSEHALASLMVGREMSDQFPPRRSPMGEVALRVSGLSVPGLVSDVSFEVRRGEVFGFAGLIGAGRTELAEAIFGLRPREGGSVELDGQAVNIRSPRDAVQRGLAYVSEDRRGRGLVMSMPIVDNTTLVSLRRYCRPLIRRRDEIEATQRHRESMGIRLGRPQDPVATLSGGNQQKVSIAKWLEVSPRVLILDEPTRGVDVGAKGEIYRLIHRLAGQGMACVLISSEMNELLGLCHRIAVMRAGRLVATLEGDSATEEGIMKHAAAVSPRADVGAEAA
jgi:ribose transport system ATP-binding protein